MYVIMRECDGLSRAGKRRSMKYQSLRIAQRGCLEMHLFRFGAELRQINWVVSAHVGRLSAPIRWRTLYDGMDSHAAVRIYEIAASLLRSESTPLTIVREELGL